MTDEMMTLRALLEKTPIGKRVFHIFDAVEIYAALENLTAMRPVVVDPKVSFAELIDELHGTSMPIAKDGRRADYRKAAKGTARSDTRRTRTVRALGRHAPERLVVVLDSEVSR